MKFLEKALDKGNASVVCFKSACRVLKGVLPGGMLVQEGVGKRQCSLAMRPARKGRAIGKGRRAGAYSEPIVRLGPSKGSPAVGLSIGRTCQQDTGPVDLEAG